LGAVTGHPFVWSSRVMRNTLDWTIAIPLQMGPPMLKAQTVSSSTPGALKPKLS